MTHPPDGLGGVSHLN